MKRAIFLLTIFVHSNVLALPTLCEIKKFFGFSNYGASIYINDRDAKRFLAKLQAGEPLPFDDPDVYDYLQNLYAQQYGINLAALLQETLGLQDVSEVQFIPLSFTDKYSEESFRAHIKQQSEKYTGKEKRVQENLLWDIMWVGAGVLMLLIPHPKVKTIGVAVIAGTVLDTKDVLKKIGVLNEEKQESSHEE